mmetsp:Transcript_16511/g.23473  ORF Transcript_16511/g.23473 Transcript_16511/m.23473 type:complete len:359 (+) Transcript_16511:251-1327(+)
MFHAAPLVALDITNKDQAAYNIQHDPNSSHTKKSRKFCDSQSATLTYNPKSILKNKKARHEISYFGMVSDIFDREDPTLFIDNPSPLTIKAVRIPPSSFPGGTKKSGFVDLIRRLSDTCYACKSVACDNKAVLFTIRQTRRNVLMPSIVWIPEKGFNLRDPKNFRDSSILDTLHTDLIDNTTGDPRMNQDDIRTLCENNSIKHLFLNKFNGTGFPFDGYSSSVKAIQSCTDLQTFVCSDWSKIPSSLFHALSDKGNTLKGIHLMTCDLANQAAYDALVSLIECCPNLAWLGLDIGGKFVFTSKLFHALPKSLKVLYIRGLHRATNLKQIDGAVFANLHVQLPNLKVRIIFPDKKFSTV